MKYPRMKCDDKKSSKICELDKKKIFNMRQQQGMRIQDIANKFNVSYCTAQFYTFSKKKQKEFRIKTNKYHKKYQHERYTQDESYRQKILDSVNANGVRRYANSAAFRKYVQNKKSN